MPYYNRAIEFSDDLRGFVRALVDIHGEHEHFDLQVRNGDCLSFYYGRCKLLQLKFYGDSVEYSTDEWFLNGRPYPVGLDISQVQAFLYETARRITAAEEGGDRRHSCYLHEHEDYWVQRVSKACSLSPFGGTTIHVFDREAELGFADTQERMVFYNNIAQYLARHIQGIELPNMATEDFYRKTDLLGVDMEGTLWVIEAKHGRNTEGIRYSPLQLAVYQQAFLLARDEVVPGLNAVIAQKRDLGLIASNIPNIRENSDIKSGILIAGQHPSETAVNDCVDWVESLPESSRPSKYLYYDGVSEFFEDNAYSFSRRF